MTDLEDSIAGWWDWRLLGRWVLVNAGAYVVIVVGGTAVLDKIVSGRPKELAADHRLLVVLSIAVGAASGHLWRGISRSDVKELGEFIDDGEAVLLVVGASTLEQAIDNAGLNAEKHVAKQLDVSTSDVDKAIKEAATELG